MNCKNKRLYGYLSAILVVLLLCVTVFSAASPPVTDSRSMKNRVALSEEEKEYLKKNPNIIVSADASWRPLEYMKDGKYSGVICEVLKKLETYTGFNIQYNVHDSYAQALEAVQRGKADMVSGLANDSAAAEEYSIRLSKPYLTINSAVVAKNDAVNLYEGNTHKKIAVVDGDYANAEIKKDIPNSELVMCASNEDCLERVKKGTVDVAIIASYCAEYYMSVPKYSSLKTHTISDFAWQQSFGISENENPLMISILNKGIDKMSETDLNVAIYEGIINSTYDNDFVIFIYKHPIAFVLSILAIMLVIGALLSVIMISRKKEHLRMIEDGARLRLALERTHLCIWEIDIATKAIMKIDNKHEKHGFYELRENIPESVIEKGYIHPEDIAIVEETLKRVCLGEENITGCWRVKDKDSKGNASVYWWEQVRFKIVYDEKKKPIRAIGVSEDVTREKEAQRDSLTLVYNRNSFEKKASNILNERRNASLQCAFLILDLDKFKFINDNYGHGTGDRVLISVGAVLNKTFRSTDIVGRLGGDEFTVFMTSISKKEDAMKKAQELVENVRMIKEREGYPFDISCSVGVIVATKGQEDLATLYKKADTALYDAKRAGKNQYKLYE